MNSFPTNVPHPGALVDKKKKAFIGEFLGWRGNVCFLNYCFFSGLPAPLGYVAGAGRG